MTKCLLPPSLGAAASSSSSSSSSSIAATSSARRILATTPPCCTQQQQQRRTYRSFMRSRAPTSTTSARIPLSTTVFGQVTTRGERPYQEDTSSVSCLQIPSSQLRASLKRGGRISTEAERRWSWPTQSQALDEELASQVGWWGVFDGHGGDYASKYLAMYLHQIFEKVNEEMVTDTVQFTREHGGYFRRFAGGGLERWVRKEELKPVRGGKMGAGGRAGQGAPSSGEEEAASSSSASTSQPQQPPGKADKSPMTGPGPAATAKVKEAPTPDWKDNGLTKSIPPPDDMKGESLTLAERATLAFLVADRHILTRHPQPTPPGGDEAAPKQRRRGIDTSSSSPPPSSKQGNSTPNGGGSTASVLTLHSLDSPPVVWYDSQLLQLGAWHVGDTRMLLCPTSDGKAVPLTTHHHPDAPSESDRLRRLGAGVVTDSFGEARWMGALANTRALGDGQFKAAGVTAEPEVLAQVIRAERYSHVTLFSDGISSVMSDQEVVDLARGCGHPQEAARRILRFAEELGVEDNATVLVVPLLGWGKIGGTDTTAKQREFRKSKTDVFRDHRQ